MVSTICLGLRLRGGVADAKRGRESDTKEEPIKKRRRVSSSSSEIENMEVDPQPEEEVARAPTAVVRPLSSAAARSTAPSTPPASELPQASASSTTQKKQALTKTNTHKDSPRPSAAARSTARLRRRHRPQIPPGPLPAIGSVFRWVAPLTPRQLSMS